MGLTKFIEGIRFNFNNFFATCIIACCFITWWKILDGDFHDSSHVSEIRTGTLAITMLVVGYFYGASQHSKKKDDTIQDFVLQAGKKDETINKMASTAETVANVATTTAATAAAVAQNVAENKDLKDEKDKDC